MASLLLPPKTYKHFTHAANLQSVKRNVSHSLAWFKRNCSEIVIIQTNLAKKVESVRLYKLVSVIDLGG